MKPNRRFAALLAILLMAIIGGIMVILASIQDQRSDPGILRDPTDIILTSRAVDSALYATQTAKAYTLTPTGRP